MTDIDVKKQITGFFIYFIGFAGSGKLSTAVELSHVINALIVSSTFPHNSQIHDLYDSAIFKYDQTPKEVRDRMYNITQIILKVIESDPIHSRNYIFFDELIKDNEYDTKTYNSVVNLSIKMNTKLLPVVLRCDLPTLQKRIELKSQRDNKRVVDASNIVEISRNKELFVPPNAIEIENSNLSIKEVTQKIIDKIYQLL
ncbi:MAG: hypothetical protein QWI36_01140 [Wolbachia endosymbiont of Tyrophagus putrescentiae]|nr:hypothetical protein [Wolbachia endosymbiont of Tyrophagus putrescentiae]